MVFSWQRNNPLFSKCYMKITSIYNYKSVWWQIATNSLRNYWLIEEGWYDQLVPFITILDISWYKLKTLLRKVKYEVILLHRETIHFALGYKLLKLTNINLCFNKSLLKMCMCRNAFQKCGKFRIFFSGVKRISHNSKKYWNLLFRQNGKLHFLCK